MIWRLGSCLLGGWAIVTVAQSVHEQFAAVLAALTKGL